LAFCTLFDEWVNVTSNAKLG